MTGLRFLFRVTLRRLDLAEEVYHITAEASAGDEHRRDEAVAGGSLKPQNARPAQPWLWLRIAGERDRAAQGQAYRQGTEHHPHRAVEGPQGPQCDALSRNAQSAAAMVEGTLLASRRGNTPAGTLAVSEQKVCWPANHHPPTQPAIPRMHRRSGDQETRDGAYTAPQFRHPSARSRHRYQKDPAAARSRETGYDRALSPRRYRHDLRRREPARPAGATKTQETQES